MRESKAYLAYIAESITLIDRYLGADEGPDQRRFHEDSMTQDAVLRRVKTLADATTHLAPSLRERHPEVDWPKVARFRSTLAQGYRGADLERVWRTITEDLPALKAVVERELA